MLPPPPPYRHAYSFVGWCVLFNTTVSVAVAVALAAVFETQAKGLRDTWVRVQCNQHIQTINSFIFMLVVCYYNTVYIFK